jgi:hypothetical protein
VHALGGANDAYHDHQREEEEEHLHENGARVSTDFRLCRRAREACIKGVDISREACIKGVAISPGVSPRSHSR